jgi:hypothetical protein
MQVPPPGPRYRPNAREPTLQSIVAAYAVAVAVPVLLWVGSNPLAGAATLAVIAGLVTTVRRAVRLVRCFYDCRGLAFDLGGRVRITIAQTPVDGPE